MPEKFEKELNGEIVKETVHVKCDGCGANMLFDPLTQELKCPHCGTITTFEKSAKVNELAINDAINLVETWGNESAVYRCDNCGAVVVLNANESATLCPYCSTSHIVKSEELAGLKPNALYPFTIDVNSAITGIKKWAKKCFFAPRRFKRSINTDKIHGAYEPAFTFDSQTFSVYEGRVGNRHTRVVGSGKNRRVQTYVVWRRISGTYSHGFDDVMINACAKFGQKELNRLGCFDNSKIQNYEQNFLVGYVARRHEKSMTDAWNDAKSVMDSVIYRSILNCHSHDVVDYLNVSTTHNNVTYKYVLLPVYHLNYKYGKKDYSVLVNGNTAKVTGKSPVSPWKVIACVLGGIVLLGIITYIFLNS